MSHTGEKPFKCDICNIAFSQYSSLSTHKRTHIGEKPFKCDICNKAFSQSTYLSRHKRTHTGEKPFVCHICKKAFSRADSLKRHNLSHTGDKPNKIGKISSCYIDCGNTIKEEIKEEIAFDEDPLNIHNEHNTTKEEELIALMKIERNENEYPTLKVDCDDTIQREIKEKTRLDEDPLTDQTCKNNTIGDEEQIIHI